MRTFEAGFLNEVANHPDVRPLLGGGTTALDLTPFCDDVNNFCFQSEDGGFIVSPLFPEATVYECHTLFKPGANFRRFVDFMFKCQDYLFIRTSCDKLVTRVPDVNRGAGKLSKMARFTEEFRRENAWEDGGGVSYQSLLLDRWVSLCSTTLEAGKVFHELLEQAKLVKGSVLPAHVDEEIHDRWAGAAFLMTLHGNTAKGVGNYNLWAKFAGYAPARVISYNPPTVDIVDAIVSANAGIMEVVLCR